MFGKCTPPLFVDFIKLLPSIPYLPPPLVRAAPINSRATALGGPYFRICYPLYGADAVAAPAADLGQLSVATLAQAIAARAVLFPASKLQEWGATDRGKCTFTT